MRLIVDRATPGLAWCDRVADAAWPVAVALLCLDARYAAYLTVLVWLIWRLLLQVQRYPLAVVFLLLLGAQAGQFVLERDLQPSSASDPLVIALGFVAMLGRTEAQWRCTLRWLALAIVPLALWASGQDPSVRLALPVGGINRLGFLLGLLQLSAWAAAGLSRSWWSCLGYSTLVLVSVPIILHNGSRVAFLAPPLAVAITVVLAVWRRSEWLPQEWMVLLRWRRQILQAFLAGVLVMITVVARSWYLNPSVPGGNVLSDRGRIDTSLCWTRQPLRRGEEKLLFGLGYNQKVQRYCGSKALPSMAEAGRPDGLPHAHNLFAQVVAENGLLGLLSLGSVLVLLARQVFMDVAGQGAFSRRLFFYGVPLLLYLAMNGLVSSFQLFLMTNQLLIGLGLASLWRGPQSESIP
jgi:hypothetical protein